MKTIVKETQKNSEKMANLVFVFFMLSVLFVSLLVLYFNQ